MNALDSQPNKSDLRRSLLKAREALHPTLWKEKSDRICDHLRHWPTFQQAKTVLVYFSFRNEPDLGRLLRTGKRWGFPRCVAKDMHWHLWMPSGSIPLQTGTYGIPEPHPTAPVIRPQDVDLILVPSVACDVRGYRLGYGGGYYDRMLIEPEWRSKPTLGIVFEFARLPKLPTDPWDRPLQGICTEAGLFLRH